MEKEYIAYKDDKRTLTVKDYGLHIQSGTSVFCLPVQNLKIETLPCAEIRDMLKKAGIDPKSKIYIPYNNVQICLPVELSSIISKIIADVKEREDQKIINRKKPENIERNKIEQKFIMAFTIENSDSDDNVWLPCKLRAEAKKELAEWQAKYPQAAKKELAAELMLQADKKRSLATGALLYDADGGINKDDQQKRHDDFIKKAEELEKEAKLLLTT